VVEVAVGEDVVAVAVVLVVGIMSGGLVCFVPFSSSVDV